MAPRDHKLFLFGALNVVQGLIVGAVPLLVPSRVAAVNWVLWAAAALMLLAGPGLALGGRWGRRLAISACLSHWLIGLVAAALIAASSSYLYGIYGHHGQSVGAIGFVLAAVVLVAFWLIPGHEIVYLARGEGAR